MQSFALSGFGAVIPFLRNVVPVTPFPNQYFLEVCIVAMPWFVFLLRLAHGFSQFGSQAREFTGRFCSL